MKRTRNFAIILLAGTMVTSGWGQATAKAADEPKPTADKPAADNKPQSEPTSVAGPDYVIGANDMLHISVWKEPELTEALPVRSDGKISLPLLNDVVAAGLTPTQLAESITTKLKKYISDPRVTVVVTAMNSQKIYILGEVLHPGTSALTPNMTVLQALASSGFSQFANTKGIYILRAENGKQQKIPVHYRELLKGEGINQNIILKPGDTIVVP
ncbi:MAG TPA: polysaccharide biosynthesis/export family protein [Terriglobales bacterium]|nr:polysaccharide biosynthesis/export family protein [Terriglobales bacterium]